MPHCRDGPSRFGGSSRALRSPLRRLQSGCLHLPRRGSRVRSRGNQKVGVLDPDLSFDARALSPRAACFSGPVSDEHGTIFTHLSPLPGLLRHWPISLPASPLTSHNLPPRPTWLFRSLRISCLFLPLSALYAVPSAWNAPRVLTASQD